MSTKRIVSILIAVVNAIIFIGLFLPYSGDMNVMESTAPYSYLILAYAIIGMLTCILNRKIELNYMTSGTILAIMISVIIVMIQDEIGLDDLSIGFFVFLIAGILLFALTFVHGFLRGGVSSRKAQTTAVSGTTNTGGVVQQTNSLNMNMPVNNYQSLPVTQKEKEKAPMDMLMSAGPNTVQSHMTELGLQSINISQENPNGVVPNAAAPVGVPIGMPQPVAEQTPAIPQTIVQQQPVQQAPVQQPIQQAVAQPGAPAPAPVPQQPRPDLLAGSQMSGQMDNSPFNPVPLQGPGQFL